MPTWNATASSHRELMNTLREFAEGYGEITYPIAEAGTGDGPITAVAAPPPAVSETWTLVCTTPGGHGVAVFSVTGSVSGAQAAATVGTFYDNGLIEFVIQDGGVNFVAADQFDIVVTQSSAVTLGEEWTTERWEPPAGEYLSVELSNMDFAQNCFTSGSEVASRNATTGIVGVRLAGAVEVTEYGVRATNNGFDATEQPQDWTFEYSDDGVNWTVEDTVSGETGWSANELRTYAVSPGRHLYYRINITDNNGAARTEFNEFHMKQAGSNFTILSEQCLILRGQGLAGTDNIYIGYQNTEDLFSPYTNWRLNGFIGYSATDRFNDQPGGNTNDCFMLSNDEPLEYWLTGNGRYIHLTQKILTDYIGCYMGLLLPYGQPSEYSYPLVILGGSGEEDTSFTDNTSYNRMFCDAGPSAGYVRTPGGTWREIQNWGTSTSVNTDNQEARIWPYGPPNGTGQLLNTYISDAIDFTQLLTPTMVLGLEFQPKSGDNYEKAVYGEIQDVYHVSGSNNTPENPVTIGGDNFICFQNVFRTGFADFYAVRLVP